MQVASKLYMKKLMDNPFVYHYTSVDALLSILEGCRKNENNSTLPFWAGCVYNSNDPREMELGYEAVKLILPQFENSCAKNMNLSEVYTKPEYEEKCIQRFSQRPKDGFVEMSTIPYAISFSCKRDFLPMWSMYGNDKRGVCLKFNLGKLIDDIKEISDFVHYECCQYNIIKEQMLPELYNFIVMRMDRGNGEMSISDKIEELSLLCECISPFVKSDDWAYESEFRVVSYKHYGPNYINFFNDFSVSPFCGATVKVDNHDTISISADTLEEIIIGPLANYDVLEHTLRNELNECMLNHVEITQSSINITK